MKSALPADAIAAALKNCETEPIHLLPRTQAYGALITISQDDPPIILRCTDNLQQFFLVPPSQVLGSTVASLIGDDQAKEIIKLAKEQQKASTLLYAVVDENIIELQTTLHHSGAEIVVEFEPIPQPYSPSEMLKLFESVRLGMDHFLNETSLEECCHYFTQLVRSITHFERVMLYRFDDSWDGEVIAESRIPESASYLGHRFPASDIPPQARALYANNPLRFVMDGAEPPSSLLSLSSLSKPLDMSNAILRAFSPVHVEYLQNMGVRASLSVSIMVRGKLWGLIACHSSQPHFVSHPIRNILEFIGGMIALRNTAFEKSQASKLSSLLDEAITSVTRDIYSHDDVWLPLYLNQELILGLVEADSAIIRFDGQFYMLGAAVSKAVAEGITAHFAQSPKGGLLVTESLASIVPLSESDRATAAGVLAFSFGQNANFCAWLRPEKIRQIQWAGPPNKEVLFDENGAARIGPRHSFDTWTETWHERSAPWIKGHIEIAEVFARTFLEALNQRSLKLHDDFRRVFNANALEVDATLDPNGVFISVRPESRQILGIAPEALVGTQLADLAIPEDAHHINESLRKLATQKSVTITYRALINNLQCWLESTLKISTENAKAHVVLAVTKDVTEEQNFRKAVEEYQQQNQRILYSNIEAVLAVDADGLITYANTTASELLGWSIDELIGKHAHDTIHYQYPDGRPFPRSACDTTLALASGKPYTHHEDVYFRRDGSPIQVIATSTAILEQGNITGAIVLFVAYEGGMLNPLVAHDHAGAVMTLDSLGIITSYSEDLTRITGYSAVEAIGQPASLLNSNVHTHCFFRSMWETLEKDGHWRGIVWNKCKDNSIRPFWVSLNAVSRHNGKIIQYIAIYGEADPEHSPEAQIMYMATHDRLTSLPNRNEFARDLRQAMARASRRKNKVVVGFIDIDHFKMINDAHGHHLGDQFLTEISNRLLKCCREEDSLARWGGDEFVFLMGDVAPHEDPLDLAQRVLDSLSEPIMIDSVALPSSASIGIAIYPDDSLSAGNLIQAADKAMYQAKQTGRNQIAVYSTSANP